MATPKKEIKEAALDYIMTKLDEAIEYINDSTITLSEEEQAEAKKIHSRIYKMFKFEPKY